MNELESPTSSLQLQHRDVAKSGLRFHYYRCTHKNKKKHCEDRGFVRDYKFAAEVKRNTSLVTIPEEWKERFLAKIETWEAESAQATQKQIARASRANLLSLNPKSTG